MLLSSYATGETAVLPDVNFEACMAYRAAMRRKAGTTEALDIAASVIRKVKPEIDQAAARKLAARAVCTDLGITVDAVLARRCAAVDEKSDDESIAAGLCGGSERRLEPWLVGGLGTPNR